MGASFCFKKNERLTSKLLMEQLFGGKDTKAVTAYPLRAVYVEVDHHGDDAPVQVLISVSKRHFKHAVDRNRVKRQLREAYRHNRHLLPQVPEGRQLLIAFIWLSDSHAKSERIEGALVKALQKICERL